MTTRTPASHRRPVDLATSTLHGLLYLASAIPLAVVWLVVILTGFGLAVGLVVTPLVFGVLIAAGASVRFVAWVEGFLARRLLRAPTYPRRLANRPGGYWRGGLATLRDGRVWRGVAFGWLRVLLGLPTAALSVGLTGAGLAYVAAPLWYRFVPADGDGPNGIDLGAWKIDTLGEALLLVPAGLLLVAAGVGLVHLFRSMWRGIATGVLGGNNV